MMLACNTLIMTRMLERPTNCFIIWLVVVFSSLMHYDFMFTAGKLLGEDNFPLKIPPNELAVVGPDDKPVCYQDKQPVFVPKG